MIHEENKKQQTEEQDFTEMIVGNNKKNTQQEQQAVTHWDDFTADERCVETEDTKPTASNTKRTTSKSKKLTKEDYCGQFFKIPNTTASKGKSVYVQAYKYYGHRQTDYLCISGQHYRIPFSGVRGID